MSTEIPAASNTQPADAQEGLTKRGSELMTIHQCEIAAQNASVGGVKELPFMWLASGRLPVSMKWLDPFMGFVQIAGEDGFVMTRTLDEISRDAKCLPMWVSP